VEEGALLVRDLLARVPSLTVLVTSRRRLDLGGEQEFPVAPLPAPTGVESPERLLEWASVGLFVDRARQVRTGFAVTGRNARAVARVCEKLEGLPLALELAAARAGVLTPAQMEHQLSHRLDLLVSQRPDVDPRHRSMRAALDWSFQLLPPAVRRFFARLSIFRGDWTLEAAEAVCGVGDGGWADTCEVGGGVRDLGQLVPRIAPASRVPAPCPLLALDFLEQLRHNSLVLAEDSSVIHRSSSGEPWEGTNWTHGTGIEGGTVALDSGDTEMSYRMLETVRQYAAEQLSSEEQAKIGYRHAAYYLSLAERAEPELTGEAQAEWLDRLERELENVRAALDWAVTHAERSGAVAGPDPGELGLRLAGALAMFWDKRYYRREDYTRLARLLSLEGTQAQTEARAKALQMLGKLASWLGRPQEARSLLEECLSIRRELGDNKHVAGALAGLGQIAFSEGDYEAARASLWESLALSRALMDGPRICVALEYLGQVARTQGDFAIARSNYEESLTIRRQLGDRLGIADCLDYIGHLDQEQGDFERARSLHEQSLAIRRELGDRLGVTYVLSSLGQACYLQGELVDARRYFRESLPAWQELDNGVAIAWDLNSLGLLADRQGEYVQARSLLEQSLAIRRRLGDRWGVPVSLNGLARVARHHGNRARAAVLCRESLALYQEQGIKLGMVQCLENMAAAALEPAASETRERPACVSAPVRIAARLFGAAEAARDALGTPLFPVDRPEYDRSVAAARGALGEEAFVAAWAEGRALELEQAVASALEVEL
jgi:tetratricopeptide (TPR) repeat protein